MVKKIVSFRKKEGWKEGKDERGKEGTKGRKKEGSRREEKRSRNTGYFTPTRRLQNDISQLLGMIIKF